MIEKGLLYKNIYLLLIFIEEFLRNRSSKFDQGTVWCRDKFEETVVSQKLLISNMKQKCILKEYSYLALFKKKMLLLSFERVMVK